MKYYCEVADEIIINTGTFKNELLVPEGLNVFEITKEQYDLIVVGKTLAIEIE